jgi:hypothetical protein
MINNIIQRDISKKEKIKILILYGNLCLREGIISLPG